MVVTTTPNSRKYERQRSARAHDEHHEQSHGPPASRHQNPLLLVRFERRRRVPRRPDDRQHDPRAERLRPAAVLGLATGSTPVGVYRELIRMHRDEGLDLSRRRHVQPGRVLRACARTGCRATTAGCTRTSSSTSTSRAQNIHIPDGSVAAGRGRGPLPQVRRRHPPRRRHRPAAAGHRPQRAHRLQRAVRHAEQPHPPGHARPGHAQGRRQRLLPRGERAQPGPHDGHRHDPRGPADHAPGLRRAQGADHPRGRSKARRPTACRPASSRSTPTPRSSWTRPSAAELTGMATPWVLGNVEWTDAADQAGRAVALPADGQGAVEARRRRLPRAQPAPAAAPPRAVVPAWPIACSTG